ADDQAVRGGGGRRAYERAVTGPEVDVHGAVGAGTFSQSSAVDPVFFFALHEVHAASVARARGQIQTRVGRQSARRARTASAAGAAVSRDEPERPEQEQ